MTDYWAHSDSTGLGPDSPGSRWQRLCEHLTATADIAATFAKEAAPSDRVFVRQARTTAALHDIGKYSDEFQKLLRGEVARAPHSAHGAAAAFENRLADVAFAIAGHHGGLPNKEDLKDRFARVQEEVKRIREVAAADCPAVEEALGLPRPDYGVAGLVKGPRFDLWTRMLFSCLIDADRTDTARSAGEPPLTGAPLDAARRLASLLSFSAEKGKECEEGPVKSARAAVLGHCLEAAARPGNLFSLMVPTGGAKTLAAMAFALKRAALKPESVRRIIVVIPYLSIIEQNAAVYRRALGDDAILEHHSGDFADVSKEGAGSKEEERYVNPARRVALENWDAPVVVTTSVRFFESLFSNRPAELRRLHNIARSVVILDEVQTLPRRFVEPILSMIGGLAADWGTTFVFSTATQPAFEKETVAGFVDRKGDKRWEKGKLQEIIPEPGQLFQILKRVEVEWPKAGERITWPALAERLEGEERALIIVNTRDHAKELFETLKTRPGVNGGVLHLSTRLCPIDRLERIRQIRARLAGNERCIVVSTQLVEAGVDLDFPLVWRAMGPLDSIAQAAGRCDREGKATKALGKPAGRVVVFVPEDGKMPPGAYREAADITAAMSAAGPLRINDVETIRSYFEKYYNSNLDVEDIAGLRMEGMFKSISEKFALIEDQTESVIVPRDDTAKTLIQRARFGGVSLGVRRALQPYTVNLFRHTDFRKARALGVVDEIAAETGVWVAKEGFYDAELGFVLTPSGGRSIV